MIYALIVIYNKYCEDVKILKYFSEHKDIKIVIFDNSPGVFNEKNAEFCKKNKYMYYTLTKNIGLSKAYNYAIDKINLKENDYLIILDDDTKLNEDYFSELKEVCKTNKYDILMPLVFADKLIMSPSNVQFGCRVQAIKNAKEIDLSKITGINSGMIIKGNVFKKVRYNEDLFLEYVDHYFMKQIRCHDFSIYIMNSIIYQNYSRFQRSSIESEIIRFKIYKKDFKKYCIDCNNIFFYILSITKYRIRQCLKYKTLKFLFI